MATKAAVEEADYTGYVDKEPTALQEAFAEWLVDQVGVKFSNKQAEKAFGEGVRLATTLRMQFQASPEWRSDERNSRYAGGAKVDKATATANGGAKTATKSSGRGRAAKPAETEDEAPAKSARRGRPASAAKAPAPAKQRGRPASGRRGSPKPDESGEAPY